MLDKLWRASDRHRSDVLERAQVSDDELAATRDVLRRILTAVTELDA
ncbi:MAG: hypothetical protein JWO57_2977 [Pseudonocardiales bacterium]|nr:hypothetical protein [Pseudonocardiales bacterium]